MEPTICPCNGERSNKWHDEKKLPRCEAARAARILRRDNRRLGLLPWKPGSPIEIPEFDPL